LKLPEPVENPHRAFCCKGCYAQFYRKRCLVCERSKAKPDGKINIKHPTCWRHACKAELRQYPHVFVRELPSHVRAGPDEGSAHSAGLKKASETGVGWSSAADGAKRIHLDDGRVFRVWGPKPTKRQVELWATPMEPAAEARLARTNALPEGFCRGGSGVPYNVVGGYRFPNEPNRRLRKRALTGLETRAKAVPHTHEVVGQLGPRPIHENPVVHEPEAWTPIQECGPCEVLGPRNPGCACEWCTSTIDATPSPYPQSDDPWCIPDFLLRTTEKSK
jgi:hypothetical protein